MHSAATAYRLDGIYPQRQAGCFMQRVKLPAGVLSSEQARTVARIAGRFGKGTIHLTTRGSLEVHWLQENDLAQVKRELAKVGLTARGACGGAVRGITCGSQNVRGFPVLEALARRLQRHFTGNPRFERLPKKFKIGIEAGTSGGRHLIQDVGLVLAGADGDRYFFDVWVAGGLGREPRPGFLLSSQVAEERIIPLIEAILKVYITHVAPPKRLKSLAAGIGEESLRQLILNEECCGEILPAVSGYPEQLTPAPDNCQFFELPIFAGQLTAGQLEQIAVAAENYADGVLMVTADQDIALQLSPELDAATIQSTLQQSLGIDKAATGTTLRVCPGSHECLMGLVATRDVACRLQLHASKGGRNFSWALSGCPNSCSQPQLAHVGIVCSRLATGEDGEKVPLFDLYCRRNAGLGQRVRERLTLADLLAEAQAVAESLPLQD
jgi:ferredoxin-nitrite reductase